MHPSMFVEPHLGHTILTSYGVCLSFSCWQQQASWSIFYRQYNGIEPIFRPS